MLIEFFSNSISYACGLSTASALHAETSDAHKEAQDIARQRGYAAYRLLEGTMFHAEPVSEIIRVTQ